MKSKKFSKIFYDLEDALNFAFENDYFKIIEYKDNMKAPYFTERSSRVGLISNGEVVLWDEWDNKCPDVKSVYRVRTDLQLNDNFWKGII